MFIDGRQIRTGPPPSYEKKYIEWSIGDLKGWNIGLPEKAKGRIEARKNKILKDQNLVAALGFPLKKRENNPLTYVAPEIRRKLPQRTIIASSQPYVPEPVLELEEYDNIISIIKRTAVLLERSPQAFKEMDEENLRDQFLVPLNSHYEGQATGETQVFGKVTLNANQ
ncbi:MAG TPA: hypothetical protein DCK76_07045 [Desulfotomaculum sp.]|nr:MAG: Uncharacterized protein XD75_0433 [Parcubacteria bacterium 33_209]HAG11125.1 hypothetical protein [Desulfotomaculum sp.]HBY03703.1 hypothetical protein [Desulfotomaculum sp.]